MNDSSSKDTLAVHDRERGRSVNHELRGQVGTIVAFAELLCDETLGPLSRDQAEAVQAIERAARKIVHASSELSGVFRAEA